MAERFRRLPGLFVADVGVAHGGADILVAEEPLDLSQILYRVVEQDCGRGVPEPMGCYLPTPRALQAERSRKLNARLESGDPE